MITSKTGSFMESKVRVERVMENGETGKINELYVVSAASFTECESKMNAYIPQYTQGEFNILTEAYAKYKEIFLSDDTSEDIFYKVKVEFITIDEKTSREKKTKVEYLVQASSVESAKKNVDEGMGGSMVDYRILSVSETAILDLVE